MGLSARLRRRPVVGVTSSRGRGRFMWWFHWLAMQLFGIKPVRLVAPHPELDPEGFDGLIIGGGDDISATLYDGELRPDVKLDPARDAMELELLRTGIERKTPILGVCRGAQMLNVHCGGTLHEEIREVYEGYPDLRTPLPAKEVTLAPGSRLQSLMRRDVVRVNSIHHQSVDRVGAGLRIVARDRWGAVQAIESVGETFRIGVQWHPEFLIHHRAQRRLYEGFVQAVRARARARGERAEAMAAAEATAAGGTAAGGTAESEPAPRSG